MRVARLLLCCILLEDYSTTTTTTTTATATNLGLAAITSDADARHDESPAASSPTLPDLPSFSKPIGNVTAALGKEAILSCTIRRLGNYKVGWIRAEDQTILSIGQRTVTISPRIQVANQTKSTNEEESTWRLHIRQLKETDRGCYMCQLNTKPMLNQLGCVDVLVPPDILASGTSEGEVVVAEGENVTLVCKASGKPPPSVLWRREKNIPILLRRPPEKLEVREFAGEKLELTRVDRSQMGAYLCIAKNEVPPGVSKRVYLRVNFPPTATVPNELVGSPLDTDVTLICLIEAYPKTLNSWRRQEQVILNGEGKSRYEVVERVHTSEEWKTTFELKIKRLQKADLGKYTCSASSSRGTANATLSVREIERPTLPTRATSANLKKPTRGKSKTPKETTNKRVSHQVSTPALQKSTAPLIGRYSTTSTTADPRASLEKDKHALKDTKDSRIRNTSNGTVTISKQLRIMILSFLTFLTLR